MYVILSIAAPEQLIEMSDKILPVLKLFLALFLCGLLSLGVYALATPFVYAMWHCPPPRECDNPAWIEFSILFIISSPVLIFALGAYFCRNLVVALTETKFLRVVLLLGFTLFPLFVFGLLIVYIVKLS